MLKWLSLIVALYLAGYALLRVSLAERWDVEGKTYIVFPASAAWLYELYRPVAYADGRLTGVCFHIGPHQP